MALEKELVELKSVLRSLVVSSPTQVDVRTLTRDYHNMVGYHIPVKKFGYREPVTLLKELCSDCFLFQGPAANPVLTLIVPETLEHVDRFVQKQKISSSVKYKGKRRSVRESITKPSTNLIRSCNQNSPNREPDRTQQQTNIVNITNKQTKQSISHQPQLPIAHSAQVFQKKETNTMTSQSSLHSFLKKSSAQYQTKDFDNSSSIDQYSREDDDLGRRTSSSLSSSKRQQLAELRREVCELVAERPEGVWCADLMRLFRERYGRELNYTRFGLTSALSLACGVQELRVAHHAPSDDWLLSDAARPPPPAPRPRTRARPAPAPAPAPFDPDDALPGVPFAPDVYPEDCMSFLESIPPVSLADVGKGCLLEVAVAEVYSPSHFWLIRLGEQHHIALENLMDEMNEYFASAAGRARMLSAGAVRVGQYCSSCYDGDWHRSLIVRILDSETVKVRHVDYGTVERCGARALRPLLRRWAALPAQAVRARLGAVRPPAAARRWQHAASVFFLNRVRNKHLVASVAAVDPQDGVLEVILIDTSTEEDRCIVDEMIQSGHAERRTDSALGTSECYLYPRFEALESAATPNYSEIHTYLRDGIDLDCVEDFRRHVPPRLPPWEPAPASPSPPRTPDAPAPPRGASPASPRALLSPPASPLAPPASPRASVALPASPRALLLPPVSPRAPLTPPASPRAPLAPNASPCAPRAPLASPHAAPAPPAPRAAPPARAPVTLPGSDVETFELLIRLQGTDAATRFMQQALRRAAAPSAPSTPPFALNPHAPVFCASPHRAPPGYYNN